jgi:hypothetical protein
LKEYIDKLSQAGHEKENPICSIVMFIAVTEVPQLSIEKRRFSIFPAEILGDMPQFDHGTLRIRM